MENHAVCDPGLDGHHIRQGSAGMVAVHQNLSPGVRCYVIGEQPRIFWFYRSRGIDTARREYFASENVNCTLIGIHAHLVIIDKLRTTHLAGVIAYLHPVASPRIVKVKVALYIIRSSYRVIQVTTKHEYIFADGIKDHFVTGSRCGSIGKL